MPVQRGRSEEETEVSVARHLFGLEFALSACRFFEKRVGILLGIVSTCVVFEQTMGFLFAGDSYPRLVAHFIFSISLFCLFILTVLAMKNDVLSEMFSSGSNSVTVCVFLACAFFLQVLVIVSFSDPS